jgi:hypothetical protein
MKLSEAIRLGAILDPKGMGPMAAHDGAERTCALGAARKAVGFAHHWGRLKEVWPILDLRVTIPRGSFWKGQHCPLMDAIYKLNDDALCEWTRERIAEWVATIEAQQECIGHPAKTNAEDAALVSGAGQ